MSRKSCIDIIEHTFAPDSRIPEVAAIGKELLVETLCVRWREMSDEFLLTLSRLCQIAERTKSKQVF